MISLVLAILFGLGITFFAFQNATGVPVHFAGYSLTDLPLYFVIIVSVVSGIIMAWIISAVDGLSHRMTLRRKEGIINDRGKEITSLQERIHELQLENMRLRGAQERQVIEEGRDEVAEPQEISYRPSLWERLFPSHQRRYTKI